ncbi:MAG TPA: class I SAM-dependent methyltransferase, partial [Candidatus Limnocylindria bacterium]|nr:class I SAM-dependent methyltransferase [Candidatus Limnocylindria bacterium]
LLWCAVREDWTAIAREGWERAGMAERIELRIAPALETLQALPKDALIDLAFIDADKENYGAYYDRCMELVRPKGLIILDNVLRGGRVLDPADSGTKIIDALNKRIRNDPRVENVLLPVRDGIMLARKL